uniref:Uncharacterized protein n=1 Tax=Rhizoctonia solani TaxID=456999 RepID=N0A568_9AGAM|nr:hypothetical protein RSOL_m00560 [Rhizoctonia solani]AGK45390.1 hypothetical protein RSOL_m00560 [Rhizoctonia solani]
MSLNHSIERLDPLRIQPFHEMKRHNLGQINLCNKLISFLNLDLKSSDSLRPLHLEKMEVDQHRRVFEVFWKLETVLL